MDNRPIRTTDNNSGKSISELGQGMDSAAQETVLKALRGLSGLTLEEIAKNNGVFAATAASSGRHYAINQPVFTIIGNDGLATGNYAGYLSVGDVRLEIRSRFSEQDKDYFLHYLLLRVFCGHFLNYEYQTDREDGLALLPLLFPYYLKKALSKGVFRTYVNVEYNEQKMKGALDAARHLRLNTPFNGKIACRSRERLADNPVMWLVRLTIEVMKHDRDLGHILRGDPETLMNVRTIIAATPGFSSKDREWIIAANLRILKHPYYFEYEPLRKICIAILRHKRLTYGSGARKIYGVLFDMAWLWEQFLGKLLAKGLGSGFHAPDNIGRTDGAPVFSDDSQYCYPDFYDDSMVLDAKYKSLTPGEFRGGDLYQIITYMHILSKNFGVLIYPSRSAKDQVWRKALSGMGGIVATIPFAVPQHCAGFEDFRKQMNKSEVGLIDYLQKLKQ